MKWETPHVAGIDAIEQATVEVTVNDNMGKQKTRVQAVFQLQEIIEWE